MINLFSGTPGSGKSLHLAREITYYLNRRKDCAVIANFPIVGKFKHMERFHQIDYDDIIVHDEVIDGRVVNCGGAKYFAEFSKKWFDDRDMQPMEGRIILIIDECQLYFNSRDWNTRGRREWLSFFTQHRKLGYSVILVAQFDLMIDKQVRALIEYEYVHRKITNNGVIGLLIKLLCAGDIFVSVERWYGINQKTGNTFFRAKKKYYGIYDTYQTFNGLMDWCSD